MLQPTYRRNLLQPVLVCCALRRAPGDRFFSLSIRQLPLFCLVFAPLLLVGCSSSSNVSRSIDLTSAKYVGREACVKCHQEQAKLFAGSHHDLAMQPATEETVLADFNNQTLVHHDVESLFYRKDDRFMVRTEGPDGGMADFEVKYVFGVQPLQQYMVELPGASQELAAGALPRVQVLRLCWDTNRSEWFYLPPPDVTEKLEPDDDLHWTGIAQRWNTMCAECHSTDYQKNFALPDSHGALATETASRDRLQTKQASTGIYNSTFMEIDVSCEACHGPGSMHVEMAGQWFPGWSREKGYGLANLKLTAENQIQACAPCHSRRNVIAGGFRAGDNFYDYYASQLLTESVYYPDGQILDEDYVHGSFIQSKMYHKGIRCTDCHDPHSARLKHDGNQVCTSCHQHPVAKYDSVSHHFHKPESAGAQCVNCHMPATTYMAVDARRDHSLRIPRPDLSLQIGTPNACTGCHLELTNVPEDKRPSLRLYQDWMLAAREGDADVQAELDRANQWCDDACNKWYGESRRRDEHFGSAIYAAQQGLPDAKSQLERVLEKTDFAGPAIARATALQELLRVDPLAAAESAERLIADSHPTVRAAAASAILGTDSPNKAVGLLETALKDPVRSVRVEAARNLLNLPSHLWSQSSSAAFRNALDELRQGLQYSNDRSGAHLALGILAEQEGRYQQAIQHYEAAVAVEPGVTGPRTNLASLLERNLEMQARSGSLNNDALLLRIQALRKEELQLLERDVNLLPDNAPIQYRYGLSLYLNRDLSDDPQDALEKAAKHLVLAAELEPEQAQYAQATAMLFQHMERWGDALQWAEDAVRRSKNDPQYVQLLQSIQAQASTASLPPANGN
ncbi:MAG: hypothetical protein KDB22_09060 [Planctomycetales bacterium]|nr:hypothetical protein [Planctomycetales bacterium]